jgi:hypothetical protein
MTDERGYGADDCACAFAEGFEAGKTGRELTEDDLIPWPPRLKKSFTQGFACGLTWAKKETT